MILLLFCLVFLRFITSASAQDYCDQRSNGGILVCCKGLNSSCWVRIGKSGNCFCDEHCLTANDCCSDYKQCPEYRGISTTVVPTENVPHVKKINASVLQENQVFVRLKCVWEYDGNASAVMFHVRWIGDQKDPIRRIDKTFNGTEKREYLYENEYAGKGHPDARHYTFNKEAFCEIRSAYIGGNWSNWMRSNKLYTGITVYPQLINLDECGNAKKRKVFITLIPHLPVRVEPFKIDIVNANSNKNAVDKICLRGVESHDACQIQLTDQNSLNVPLIIEMTTSCTQFEANDGYSSINVALKYPVKGDNNKFWWRYKFPEIKIFITKSIKRICKSETDPHFKTFDGRYFDFMGVGTFLLYYNKHIGVRVEGRQKSCGFGASCNCGIAIKEGIFYKIYDMCQVENTVSGTRWWHNPDNLIIRKRGIKDSRTNGFYTLETSDGSSTTYDVYLPSGVLVTIKRMFWGLSTYIKAPTPYNQDAKNVDHHSQGLCGNFNGDPSDDFYGSEKEFGELNRIHDQSIFDYKGNITLAEKALEDCKLGAICSCGGKNSFCGVKAIKDCYPSEVEKHHSQINAGLCGNFAKRDAHERDDDIDDQDDIPPFIPQQQNITQVPSWPTPGGLTEEEVRRICVAKIKDTKAGTSCKKVIGVDIDAAVRQCISDVQAMDNVAWANDNFDAMQETCKKNIFKNTSFYKNSTDGELKLDTEFIASLCPNGCSDHGNCSNSTCACDKDYTAADCSISLKDSPTISGIRKSGLCDVRRRPCRNVGIYGFPFLDSENLTCHVQEFKVIESAWNPSNITSLHLGRQVDLTEVKCFLPESPVNIGEYENKGITAAGLKIAVSNNGINASKTMMLFITYDSICQECNTTTGCRLKADACFISDHCFAQNESHPNDWCKQCLPHISTSSWLERKDNLEPRITTSAFLYAFRGKELRVQLSAIDPEYRTIRYSFAQNKTFGASLTRVGMFTWTKNSNDSTQFHFKVTDECGAYSVFRASVVIKECPCNNSGECNPDYRYLDGAGHFTCTCPPEYTGKLCDVDVNECILSNPCFNGACKNERPGFSCSCLAGYTGDLCKTEINECASNPCFLKVPCTDMIGSFKCGSCPIEFTGNGENCTRIDGQLTHKCVRNSSICHEKAKCAYNNGSFLCLCGEGYTGDGENNCTDVNECLESTDTCHENATCINTEGNYTCECPKGFIGDGKLNCSENEPPLIITPSSVYGILNTDLKIQIKAHDPEGEDLVFLLMSNGTATSAQITETALLTISDLQKTVTVYILVKDKKGAQNILILEVKVMRCPCEPYGKCYKKENVTYPVHKTDYICHCEQLRDEKCETGPNPCSEQPCFLGLKCSSAANSDGFTCENCPLLFEGDGKHCELNTMKGVENNYVPSKMTLKSEKWDDQLTVNTSKVYRKLVSQITIEIRKVYINVSEFSYVIVEKFSPGSIIVNFILIFSDKVEAPLKPLLKAAESGKLGNMTFEMNVNEIDMDDDKNDSRGLDTRTRIAVIITVIVLLTLVIVVIVYLRVRQKRKRKEKRYGKEGQAEEIIMNTLDIEG